MYQLLQVWIGFPQAVWCVVVTCILVVGGGGGGGGGGFADYHMRCRLIFTDIDSREGSWIT